MSILSGMSSRDRRAVTVGAAIAVPALVLALVVRPLASGMGDARDRAHQERELLARERGLLAHARAFGPELRRAQSALEAEAPRLFRGVDGLAAAAALEEHVSDAAERSRVAIRQSEGRVAGAAAEGIATLQVDLQGEGDLRGILSLLRTLDTGDRLVRVERLAIERAGGGAQGTLSFVLTAVGYMADPSARPGEPDAGQGP